MLRCEACGQIAFDQASSCPACCSCRMKPIPNSDVSLKDALRYVCVIRPGAQYVQGDCLRLIADIAPQLKRERFILESAFRCGAIDTLDSEHPGYTGDATRLMMESGISEDAANLVVEAYRDSVTLTSDIRPSSTGSHSDARFNRSEKTDREFLISLLSAFLQNSTIKNLGSGHIPDYRRARRHIEEWTSAASKTYSDISSVLFDVYKSDDYHNYSDDALVFAMGISLLNGLWSDSSSEGNVEEASRWLLASYDSGFLPAVFVLADMIFNRDVDEGLDAYIKLAEKHSRTAGTIPLTQNNVMDLIVTMNVVSSESDDLNLCERCDAVVKLLKGSSLILASAKERVVRGLLKQAQIMQGEALTLYEEASRAGDEEANNALFRLKQLVIGTDVNPSSDITAMISSEVPKTLIAVCSWYYEESPEEFIGGILDWLAECRCLTYDTDEEVMYLRKELRSGRRPTCFDNMQALQQEILSIAHPEAFTVKWCPTFFSDYILGQIHSYKLCQTLLNQSQRVRLSSKEGKLSESLLQKAGSDGFGPACRALGELYFYSNRPRGMLTAFGDALDLHKKYKVGLKYPTDSPWKDITQYDIGIMLDLLEKSMSSSRTVIEIKDKCGRLLTEIRAINRN